MIYGISLLLIVLGLVVGVPALRRLASMLMLKKNSGMTAGNVASTKSAISSAGWLFGALSASEMVNHERPLVTYQAPQAKAMSIEVIPSNFLSRRTYTTGETVEVVYDLSEPWHAYLFREWSATLREIYISAGVVAVAIILWIVGRVYHLPW